MQIGTRLPTFFRVIVAASLGLGSPGTVAAEQMPKFYSVNGDAVSVGHIMAGINQKKHKFHSSTSNLTPLYLPEPHPHPDHHTQPSTCFTHPSKYTRLCPVHITTTPLMHQPQCPFTNPIIHPPPHWCTNHNVPSPTPSSIPRSPPLVLFADWLTQRRKH